jgi:hypothetical protein
MFANGETLRFALPDEGTLRFLPGRLEVIAGPDAGREIRFVAPPGAGDSIEITFGAPRGRRIGTCSSSPVPSAAATP